MGKDDEDGEWLPHCGKCKLSGAGVGRLEVGDLTCIKSSLMKLPLRGRNGQFRIHSTHVDRIGVS